MDATGPRPLAGPRVVDGARRGELERDAEPNGWYVGPPGSPDRFELLGPGLGGGEGILWRARYLGGGPGAGLILAVKQLRRPPGARADWPGPVDVQRWQEQKELLQYLSLDHLATLIDIFVGLAPHPRGDLPSPYTPLDTPYVVTEWIPGRTLADEIAGTPATASTLTERLNHLRDVTGALHGVHVRTAYGTVGTPALLRDVKPENVVLDPARGATLVDVGTLRLVEDGYPHAGFRRPGFVAPELLDRPTAPRDATSDLYALGALAYYCVTGQDPSAVGAHADRAGQGVVRRLVAAARAARVADPQAFADHLALMLHPQPDARPADAVAWATRLRRLAVPRNRFGRTGVRIVVAAAVAFAAGTGLTAAALELRETPTTMLLRGADPTLDPPAGAAGTGGAAATAGATDPASGGPAGTAPATGDPTPTGGAASSAPASILLPANGTAVRSCDFVLGRSNLPSGRTLLLSASSLEGDGRRLGPVVGWQRPRTLGTWWAPQKFGSGVSGGDHRVDLLVVPLADLRELVDDARAEGRDWTREEPPDSARTVRSLTLHHLPGEC